MGSGEGEVKGGKGGALLMATAVITQYTTRPEADPICLLELWNFDRESPTESALCKIKHAFNTPPKWEMVSTA